MPLTGGLNIVDVDDVAAGHQLAMAKGQIGERYILGGENLDVRDLLQGVLPEATGLSPPLSNISRGTLMWASRWIEAKARWRGRPPVATTKLVRDHLCRYMWVSSAKAERELGYTHRSALEALSRGVRWYAERGYVSSNGNSVSMPLQSTLLPGRSSAAETGSPSKRGEAQGGTASRAA
jgi:dihydroflavonol-4-reductase